MQRCFRCTCKAVRHVHVEQYDMYISYRFRCTCKTRLYTGKTFLSKKSKIQHRTTACFPHKEMHQAMVDE